MTYFLLALRLILGAVFLMSAVPKLAAPRRFARDVQQYRMLPAPLGAAFGFALPGAELAIAASLMTGYGARWGALAAAALLALFMLAIGVAMARKFNISCSCFGLLYRERVGWGTQGRDAVLLALALFVGLVGGGSPALFELLGDPARLDFALPLAASVIALIGALSLAALSVLAERRRPPSHGF